MTGKKNRITPFHTDTDADLTGDSDEDERRPAISRRTSLKLLGVAAVPVVAHRLSAGDDSSGITYGSGGYGVGGFGGETNESMENEGAATDHENAVESPTITERDVAEDSPSTSRTTIHVNWTVLDLNDAFERYLIDVFERADSNSPIESK